MRKLFEHILASILLTTTVLLGLSFWLNTKFGFNIFLLQHWDMLAQLQVTSTPIDKTFYISIGVALLILVSGFYVIFMSAPKKTSQQKANPQLSVPIVIKHETKTEQTQAPNFIPENRPPRLNLPKNISEIAFKQHENPPVQPVQKKEDDNQKSQNTNDELLSEIFTNTAYLVKPNPIISGFRPNLFAIGAQEVVWIGAVDCDINVFKAVVNKLKNVFTTTLEDIPITTYAFMIDNTKTYNSDDEIFVFNNIDDLKQFIYENQGQDIPPEEQGNFDAYSEYIDTIIQYIKNV